MHIALCVFVTACTVTENCEQLLPPALKWRALSRTINDKFAASPCSKRNSEALPTDHADTDVLLPRIDQVRRTAVPIDIFVGLSLNVLIALSVWPGFMSWDSLFALTQLRLGITSSAYPPVVSYVWWLPDLLIPGPGGMLLLQNGILLTAIGTILYCLRPPAILSLCLQMLFVATPIILGPMLVVWKDIGMSGFLAMSIALTVYASVRQSLIALGAALACLIIGGCYRLNAFPALLPLGFAGLLLLGDKALVKQSTRQWPRLLVIYIAGVAVTLAVIAASVSFRLPDLKPLPRTFNAGMTQIFDMLGISVCLQQNLVPEAFFLHPVSPDDLVRIYKPQHIQLSFGETKPEFMQYAGFETVTDLGQRWRRAIFAHPLCYLQHRLLVASFLLGANAEPVFYPTHPGLDPNDFGIKMQSTALTDRVVRYVLSATQPAWGVANALARAWIWGIIGGICCFLLIMLRRPMRRLAGLIYASGAFYFVGSVFVIPAADARYAHWFVVACFLTFSLAAIDAGLALQKQLPPAS